MTADPAARLATALADRYRLERELGQGGMATVYLAHDLKHDRQVAIKVLRPELAAVIGAERFLSEIKTTANLQHPHILPLFDSGATHPRSEGSGGLPPGHSERSEESGRIGTEFLYYVMPYIEGETLRDRLTREKQLPVADAVRLAREVADALDYAHRKGVVHRDIKPENILLHDGRALVADFGIALAASKAGDRMTQTGMSLGTPSYMSPEQAMGERDIDARSDVYALGAVTYEMLTGEPPFTGATVQAIVARVLTEEPRAIGLVRKTVPPDVEATILRALAKLPADRVSSAAEFARALGAPGGLATSPGSPAGGTSRGSWRTDPRTLGLAAVTALLLLAAVLPRLTPRAPPGAGDRLAVTIEPPPRTRFIAISWAVPAITPDGKAVVFAARGPDGSRLYLRRLDEFEARPLPGTEDAVPSLTVSPDGRWIWFPTTGLEMKKVALSGATGAVSLGALPDWWWSSPAQWSGDSLVYFVGPAAVWAVGTNATSRRQVASLDTLSGERTFSSAFPLPDARLLLSVATDSGPRVALLEPDGRRRWISGLAGTVQAVLPPDHLIVSQPDGRLTRSRLDLAAARVNEGPVAIASGAGASGLALSATGTSAWFALQRGTGRRLVWVERDGRASPTPAAPGEYRYLALSPDGQRVGFYGGTASEQFGASVIDLRSGGKVTMPSLDYASNPVWERNGRSLLVAAGQLLPQRFMRQAADGARQPTVAFSTPVRASPDWQAPDGSVIIEMLDSTTHLGVIDPAGRLRAELKDLGTQRTAKLSPDGKWLAYMSNESGRFEIYVRPWPALDRKVAVSTQGGTEPAWGPDGRELFFRDGGTLMASRLVTGPTLQFSRPEPLFDTSRYATDPTGDPSYDVGPDGRFLMVEDDPDTRIELRVETGALGPSRTSP